MKTTSRTSDWSREIALLAMNSPSCAIGLMNGARDAIDAATVRTIVAQLSEQMVSIDSQARMLHLRLNVFESRNLDRAMDQPATIPVAKRCPLGPWCEVTVPLPVGATASWSLMQLPDWLPIWKESFDLLLVELGPLHLVASRAIGRLCNRNFLILGPSGCGAPDWLMQQISHHHQGGTIIDGTIVGRAA